MRPLATELARSGKQKERIHTSRAQLNSVQMQLQLQLSQLKVVGTLQKSTTVMKTMSRLMRVGDMAKQMDEMSREMMKAGLIGEMVDDTMDAVLDGDGDEMDADADTEVDKIINEVTAGVLSTAGKASNKVPSTEDIDAGAEDVAEEPDEIAARIKALTSVE